MIKNRKQAIKYLLSIRLRWRKFFEKHKKLREAVDILLLTEGE